jgi:hypothetical protein
MVLFPNEYIPLNCTRGVKSEQMLSGRMHVTRRGLEEAHRRLVLATVLSMLLPLVVLVVAGALAGHRRWVLMQSLCE